MGTVRSRTPRPSAEHVRRKALLLFSRVLGAAERPVQEELEVVHLHARAAIEAVRVGKATPAHMQELLDAMNISYALTLNGDFQEALPIIQQANDVFTMMKDRYRKIQRIGCTAAELSTLVQMMEVKEALLDNVTSNELDAACAHLRAKGREPTSYTSLLQRRGSVFQPQS